MARRSTDLNFAARLTSSVAKACHHDFSRVFNIDDFEKIACRHLPWPLFGFIAGGTERNSSLARNAECFAEYSFRPHVLRDVSQRTTGTRLLQIDYAAPVGIAPMGMSALMAYQGDRVLAETAARMNLPMIMSGASLTRLEEIAPFAPNAWFQAYIPGDKARIDPLVGRIAGAGFQTLVITVDTQVLPNRENNLRAGFSTPLRPSAKLAWHGVTHPRWTVGTFLAAILQGGLPHFENTSLNRGEPILSRTAQRDFSSREHLSWEHLKGIRERWKGKLVVKGIMRPDDAEACIQLGADGIIVSNHGGRQLDGAMTALEALPEIAGQAGGRTAVMLDGGIRRGTDIAKAIALGADFVFVGRPFLYAAAVGGAVGVAKAAGLLIEEFHRVMGMLGVNDVSELTSDLLTRRPARDGAAISGTRHRSEPRRLAGQASGRSTRQASATAAICTRSDESE